MHLWLEVRLRCAGFDKRLEYRILQINWKFGAAGFDGTWVMLHDTRYLRGSHSEMYWIGRKFRFRFSRVADSESLCLFQYLICQYCWEIVFLRSNGNTNEVLIILSLSPISETYSQSLDSRFEWDFSLSLLLPRKQGLATMRAARWEAIAIVPIVASSIPAILCSIWAGKQCKWLEERPDYYFGKLWYFLVQRLEMMPW